MPVSIVKLDYYMNPKLMAEGIDYIQGYDYSLFVRINCNLILQLFIDKLIPFTIILILQRLHKHVKKLLQKLFILQIFQ